MKRVVILIAALAVARCASNPAPAATPAVQDDWRYLVDPRIGWSKTTVPAVDRRFDAAWRLVMTGDLDQARNRLADIRGREASYAPAELAGAAIDIRTQHLDAARATVDRIVEAYPAYTAAQVYEAELDIAENRVRSAYDRYRTIIEGPNAPPTASERYAQLQTRLFDQLYNAATTATPEEAIRLLREALVVNPTATAARLLLVQKLTAITAYDEARHELDPLLSSSAVDQADVQEALAEIEVGRGQFEEAITRYERLARRDSSGRYARRLDEVKERFAAANMPPQYQRALEAESITRADLAVLMYWKIASIRFAQDVPPPPIAVDIGEIPGRDEIIRAIALGLFAVDPVTRRVNPYSIITGNALARVAVRVLTARGAPCARGVPADAILNTCGVNNPAAGEAADLPVSGRAAAAVLEQVDRAISR